MAATDAVELDPAFAAFCAAGLWPGLGRTLAGGLAAAGIRTPGDVSVATLSALPRVNAQKANRLLSSFLAAAPAFELCELLLAAGLDARLAGRTIDTLGPGAPRLIRDDPWIVLSVAGVDVATADRLARVAIAGVRPDDSRRGRALVAWVLTGQARDGHTMNSALDVAAAVRNLGVADPGGAVRAAVDGGQVVVFADDDSPSGDGPPGGDAQLALLRYAAAEESIAESIARLHGGASAIPGDVASLSGALAELSTEQRAAVTNALVHGVSVLTGGPGTGKSRTVAAVVGLAERAGRRVALAAPTGRAAKRLEQLCDAPASTIHRLLGAQGRRPSADDEQTRRRFSAGFARDSDWPLDEQLIVVDEASMLDVELADALLGACADGAHVVFVGDAAQLPSIGAGRVLGDLIDAEVVPTVELTTLYRQAAGGAIARLATAVRGGELPDSPDDPTREVVLVPARGSADAANRVRQLVTDSIPRALGIPADQVQVVTPVHRGPAGTQGLNAALKAVLNPGRGTRRFDPGDRVVATANHSEAEPNGFANGEVGTVVSVEDGTVTVDFASGPARIKGKMLVDLTHGWAITVHRAQGSEFPAVVVVLPAEAAGMLSRPLVYTALTRAQQHLSVVPAVGPALRRAVREVGAAPRRTRLIRALREAVIDPPA
ncbi:MAG: AAA family ATPase [Actinomycetota bacterium]|nr:AAA family ATPase [Actinomycetota bacterium]